jgi:hypothetical protein
MDPISCDKMKSEAKKLVEDPANWRAIEALASALIREPTIYGETATRIIIEALQN